MEGSYVWLVMVLVVQLFATVVLHNGTILCFLFFDFLLQLNAIEKGMD